MRTHLIDRLIEKAEKDERIVLLVGDLGFHVVEGFQERFPKRFVNCGIAEQNMMAVASGMAKEGDKVFVYSIGNFPTLRCLEQIRNDVCYHDLDVNIIAVGGGFSYGTLGMTHHTTEEAAILRALPNMRVYAPADYIEANALLDTMVEEGGPKYIRLARGTDSVFHQKPLFIDPRKIISLRKYETNTDGYIAIMAAGPILEEAIKAESMLKEKGYTVQIYSVPVLKPFDKESVAEISQKAQLIVSLEEHNIIGGLGGAISETISELQSHAPLVRLGLKDCYSSEVGSREYLRAYYGIDAAKITSIIEEALGK